MKSLLLLLPLCFLLLACPPPKVITKPSETETPTDPEVPTTLIGNAQFYHWIHQPLHPGNGEAIRFAVKVSDPDGISRIDLAIYEYELLENELGLPSKRRRPGGIWGTVDSWTASSSDTLVEKSFDYTAGFPAASTIEYIFTITNTTGAISRTMALFDAGTSPWPQDKILLYATQHRPLQQSINLCFFPDTDYQSNWSAFLADVEAMIYQGYHRNNKIADHKDYWNFYYTRQETDGMTLANDPFNPDRYPPFMTDSLILGIDAFGLLHREVYSDGAYLNSNLQFLAQNVFTAEGYNWGTAIHETAHAVFHLSDEYNGCVCFASIGGSNIFSTAADCQALNDSLGYQGDTCTEIIAYNGQAWYLPETPPLFADLEACQEYNRAQGLPEDSCRLFQDFTGLRSYQAFKGVCIMEDDGDRQVPNFRHACASVIDRYYDLLYPESPELVDGILAEAVDNFWGYEPVAILRLKVEGEEMEVEVEKTCYGIPRKNLAHPSDFEIRVPGKQGQFLFWHIDRPDCVHIHHGEGLADVQTTQRQSSCAIAVPLIESNKAVYCKDRRKGKKGVEYKFKMK